MKDMNCLQEFHAGLPYWAVRQIGNMLQENSEGSNAAVQLDNLYVGVKQTTKYLKE